MRRHLGETDGKMWSGGGWYDARWYTRCLPILIHLILSMPGMIDFLLGRVSVSLPTPFNLSLSVVIPWSATSSSERSGLGLLGQDELPIPLSGKRTTLSPEPVPRPLISSDLPVAFTDMRRSAIVSHMFRN